MDEGQRADLVRALRDMLVDGADPEEVLAIIRTACGDFNASRNIMTLVFGVEAEAAHEMLADSATWADRREPLLDDFDDGD
ncbi:MAG: hypothetical protein AB7O49_02820 [Sphingomonadales bacterium]